MKRITVVIALILMYNMSEAQNATINKGGYSTIRKDTINVNGIVYDYLDQPVKQQLIHTPLSGLYPITSYTDDDGRFILKGVSPKDTLIMDFADNYIKIPNNGSRYLEIYLPKFKPNQVNLPYGNVTAIRKLKKNPSTVFKISPESCCILSIRARAAFKNGGNEGFLKFVQSNIRYPQKAIDNNIEGEVEVIFNIEKDGSLSNIRLARGIGYGCDEQVLNAVKKSPNWRPAKDGVQSQVNQSSVTINFKLTDK
jgi:TonB family protein